MKYIKITIIPIVAILLAILVANALKFKQTNDMYSEALELFDNSKYVEALDLLENINNDTFKDTLTMKKLCAAHIAYDNGNIVSAYLSIDDLQFNHQPENRIKEINVFTDKVTNQYNEYLEHKRKEEEQEYITKVKNGVPFIGMSEIDIANTSLGIPSPKTRSNRETINGKQYKATIYDFTKGNTVIFTARCVQGKVINVWDYRNNPEKPYRSGSSSKSSSSKSSSSKSSSSKSSSSKSSSSNKSHTPYDAYDYDDPYDFYMDNRDSFYSYYEAEDYWYDEVDEEDYDDY